MADPYRVSRTDPLRDEERRRAESVRTVALSQLVDAIWEDWNLDVPKLMDQHPEVTGHAVQQALRDRYENLDSRVRRAARGDAKPGSNKRAISGVLANRPARPVRNARPATNKERAALEAGRLRSTRALMLSERTLAERARPAEKQPKASPVKERVGGAHNCKERPDSAQKKRHGKGGARNVSFIPWCDETSQRRH